MTNFTEEVERRIRDFNDEGHAYEFSLSYGVAFWDGDGDADGFLKEMDDRMYQMKAAHHDEIPDGTAAR